jgi:GGDEF domain-containing protein
MQLPKIPPNEAKRLKALHSLHILDTPLDENFERITRIAKQIFGVPIVAITLIDKERQWFKSSQGLKDTEHSRDTSFCAHTINEEEMLMVEDTKKDERFFDNPLVTGDLNIRFYAGVPISADHKNNIGALCLIDHKPRTLTPDEIKCLKDLSELAEYELSNYRLHSQNRKLAKKLSKTDLKSRVDTLTGVWNRLGIDALIKARYDACLLDGKCFGLAMLDIDYFKNINDRYGHLIGDEILKEAAKAIVKSIRKGDFVGRWGGEEFLVLINANTIAIIKNIALRIHENIKK